MYSINMPKNKATGSQKGNGNNSQAATFSCNGYSNSSQTTSQGVRKTDGSQLVRDPSVDFWLQNNIDDYAGKSRTMMNAIFNSTNCNDVAQKYEDLVSFVHNSLAEVRKFMNTRRDGPAYEEKLAKIECSQMRYDKQIRCLVPDKTWWNLPREIWNDDPRTYKHMELWIGLQDKRTACQFVEEFKEMVLPYNWTTRAAIVDFAFRLQCDLSKDVAEFVENIDCKGTLFTDVLKKFIDTFSNDSVHCKEIADFETAYPNDREVFAFVQFWLGKFRFNPKVNPVWVIEKLIEKLPQRYIPPLMRLKLKKNSIGSYSYISKIIYDRAAKLKEPIPKTRDYLGFNFYSRRLNKIKKLKFIKEIPWITDEPDNTNSDQEWEESSDEDLYYYLSI